MSYPSDLTDKQWALIEHHFLPKSRRGCAGKHPRKRDVDAIPYVVEGGIHWRMLPKYFPPWQTVYDHFSRWNKRHVVVDIMGNLLHAEVHAANLSDSVRGCEVLRRAAEKHPSLGACSGDAGYRGRAVRFVAEKLGLVLQISEKIVDAVLPKRWAVERTFAWLGAFRRLSKEVEILMATAENVIRIAMLKIALANCVFSRQLLTGGRDHGGPCPWPCPVGASCASGAAVAWARSGRIEGEAPGMTAVDVEN